MEGYGTTGSIIIPQDIISRLEKRLTMLNRLCGQPLQFTMQYDIYNAIPTYNLQEVLAEIKGITETLTLFGYTPHNIYDTETKVFIRTEIAMSARAIMSYDPSKDRY